MRLRIPTTVMRLQDAVIAMDWPKKEVPDEQCGHNRGENGESDFLAIVEGHWSPPLCFLPDDDLTFGVVVCNPAPFRW